MSIDPENRPFVVLLLAGALALAVIAICTPAKACHLWPVYEIEGPRVPYSYAPPRMTERLVWRLEGHAW